MPGLRVIAGAAKGRRLRMVPGQGTRPIADRAKAALFDILAADIPEAAVLDLFAGTGSVGIEALSRGAARATFVENDPLAVRTLQANLQATGLEDRARIVRADVFAYLGGPPRDAFSYIHVAPPQYHGLWARALEALDRQPAWVQPDGLAVIQVHPREFSEPALAHLTLIDQRRYGSTLFAFYERQSE